MDKESIEKVVATGGNEEPQKSLKEILQDIADEEGMTYEETAKLFTKGLKESRGTKSVKRSAKEKAKIKKKKKSAKSSRKKNR